jgi:hypothetical protein
MTTSICGVSFCLSLILLLQQPSSCNDSRTRTSSANAGTQTQRNAPPAKTQKELSGRWGGQGISFETGDSGAKIEFDCAHGTIDQKIVPDSEGKFEVQGLFVRERPGPTRQDEPKGEPVIYSGSIEATTMTLTITFYKTNEALGTYKLIQGQRGRLRKCG